jgi:hypothetical protein
VRDSLLKQGWQPVHAPEAGFVCEKGDHRCGPETIACAGTGAASCLFRWKRKKTVIEIGTVGEDSPTVTSVTCKANCR